MNRNLINETDLHIQYKMETGKYHMYKTNYDGISFTHCHNYTRDYAVWLENKLIKQINK